MKIIIADRDTLAVQMLRSRLEPLGHKVFEESSKNKLPARLAAGEFDLLFMDPSPLTDPRPLIASIRHSVANDLYIFLISNTIPQNESVKYGANDFLQKPLDTGVLEQKLDNAESLIALLSRIGDSAEDFPSAGGVIAKSAFNQLLLSAMDRANRYGEETCLLFIKVRNYEDITETDSPYAAEYAVAKLSQCLVHLRRQSDIISQTARQEYALLLQRPAHETEPMEAANRFAEALEHYDAPSLQSGSVPVEIAVSLVKLPSGETLVEHTITHTAQ